MLDLSSSRKSPKISLMVKIYTYHLYWNMLSTSVCVLHVSSKLECVCVCVCMCVCVCVSVCLCVLKISRVQI